MGTNTILRNVLLLEGKAYTPEQIDDILRNTPVTVTIHEAVTLNNRLQAINYITNVAEKPTYATALDLCKILGRDIEPYSDLRSRAILTKVGKIEALSRKDVIDSLHARLNLDSPIKQAVYLIKFFATELPFEHSNEAIGYLLACKVLLDNGESIIDFESKDIINKALNDDALLVNILSNQSSGETIEYNRKKYQVRDILTIVPPALREAYGSDYECAKQFVAEYASQIIL